MKFESVDALVDYMHEISTYQSEYRLWLGMRMRDVNFTEAEIEYLESRDVTAVRKDLEFVPSVQVWRETLPRVLFNTIGKVEDYLSMLDVFSDERPEDAPEGVVTKARVYSQSFLSVAFAEIAIENLYKAMRMTDLKKGQNERAMHKNLKNIFTESEETIFDEDLYLNHIYDNFLPAMAEFLAEKLDIKSEDIRPKLDEYKQKFVDDIYFGSALNGIETYPPINVKDWHKLSPDSGLNFSQGASNE